MFLESIRNKYSTATHNCFAFRIDKNTYRLSDDGEPAGSAGRPIYTILEKKKLLQTICVVTRYFGGIKLGIGGLVRAYSQACEECLNMTKFSEIILYPVLFKCREAYYDSYQSIFYGSGPGNKYY